jgi:hypothetical protein
VFTVKILQLMSRNSSVTKFCVSKPFPPIYFPRAGSPLSAENRILKKAAFVSRGRGAAIPGS